MRCGFCLTEGVTSEFAEHGLKECFPAVVKHQPSEECGAIAFEMFEDALTGEWSDAWLDLIEELAGRISTTYDHLIGKDEITERDEDRIMRVEDRAEHYILINLIKRMMYAYDITLEEVMA